MFETVRLYWKNPYQRTCRAKVVKIEQNCIWLDQSIFYPESGGQVGDQGTINQYQVIDTKFDSNKNIYSLIQGALPALSAGDEVECVLNWERRYNIMKLHAASHIMEHFLFAQFGKLKLLGSNVNDERDSSTYAWEGAFDEERLKEVERLTNSFIEHKHSIETMHDIDKPQFRWWKCGEIRIPCGGTHPLNTEEIGPIFLKKESSGKGKIKIKTFLKYP